jgi:hypothetical protein
MVCEKVDELIKGISGVNNSETMIERKGNTIKAYFNSLTETNISDLNAELNKITDITIEFDSNKWLNLYCHAQNQYKI